MEQKRLFKEQLLLTAMDLKKLLNKIWMVPIRKLTMFWEVPKNRSQRFNRIFQGTISAEEKPVALRATLLLILNHQTQPLLQQKEHLEAGLVEPQIQLIKPIQLLVLLLVQLGIHTEAMVVTGHHQPQGHLTKPTTQHPQVQPEPLATKSLTTRMQMSNAHTQEEQKSTTPMEHKQQIQDHSVHSEVESTWVQLAQKCTIQSEDE